MPITVRDFQRLIEDIYSHKDGPRGVETTFIWFTEEVGELAKELRKSPRNLHRLTEEIADVFAWLSSVASLLGIEMEECARIYAEGCPKCRQTPCGC